MTVNKRDSLRHAVLDNVFAGRDLAKPLPKYEFPASEERAADIMQVVLDELFLDGNPRQNLATFCQTWEEPEVHKIMDLSIDRNMIDKSEYPQTAEIELRCVHMLANLWNSPESTTTIGTSTVGSSEACMLGGLAAKWRWRERRKAEDKPTDRPNLVCGPVQVCWHKFCRYWDVELRELPMEHGTYRMTPESMLSAVDENTICVVPTFGVTYTGQYEFVAPMAEALDRYQRDTGIDVDLHVDAASGGFLAPFCAPDIVWDFRLPRVKSINTSGHKYGLAPLGAGWIVWRDEGELSKDLIFSVPYLGGEVGTMAINFSRPAGPVVSQYYLFNRLGREGYQRLQQACYDTAQWLSDEIGKLGPFEFLNNGDPEQGIPSVCFKFQDGADPGYSLYDLSAKVLERGWQVPAFSLPVNTEDVDVIRIMIRQGVSRDLASLLVGDLERAIDHFERHPVSVPMTERERGSFKHT